ncbi:MAG TPA: DUF4352 domain-containing protein [Methanoregula sp.]|nr:DUF4352 domain-containing protein [Methanoregula sp.]
MEINCPRCGSKVPDSKSQFCDKCGNKLPDTLPQSVINTCIQCGKTAPASTSLFCDYCGTQLPQPTTVNYGKVCTTCRRMAPSSESVFCDVCGTRLTPLSLPVSRGVLLPSPTIPEIASPPHKEESPTTVAEDSPESAAEKNSKLSVFVLRFALVFGIVGFFINPLIGIAIVVLSAYAVYQDAKELRTGSFSAKVEPFRTVTWRPAGWGLIVLVVWIVGLPLYLVHREQLIQIFIHGGLIPEPAREAAGEPEPEHAPGSVEEPVELPVLGLEGEPAMLHSDAGGFEPVIEKTADTSYTVPQKTEPFSTVFVTSNEAVPEVKNDESCIAEPGWGIPAPGSSPSPADGSPLTNPAGTEGCEKYAKTKGGRVTRARLAVLVIAIIAIVLAVAVVQMGMIPEVSQLAPLNFSPPQTTSAPTVNVLSVGESVSDGRQKLTVHGYEIKDKIGSKSPGDLDTEKKGYTFMVVDITAENLQFMDAISTEEFYLINAEGYLYPTEQVSGLDSLFNGTDIRPFEKRRGNLAFSVPAEPGELRLKHDLGNSIIALFLIT